MHEGGGEVKSNYHIYMLGNSWDQIDQSTFCTIIQSFIKCTSLIDQFKSSQQIAHAFTCEAISVHT